jgi:hypothetical protein
MVGRNIGYHTRCRANNAVKISGGSFGGQFDMETVERLTRLFTAKVLNSGRVVFVDRNGRECSLYITVDPEMTEIGKVALAEYHKQRTEIDRREAEKMELAQTLIDGLTADELIERLSK